jgi:uncharacterized membrane protein YeaQ/YmgE (transglycosylase-associated protein family)
MDFTFAASSVFLVIYALLWGLVAPYIGLRSEEHGSFVPAAIGIVFSQVLATLLTSVGLSYENGWTWIILMLTTPAAMWFGSKRLASARVAKG